MKKSSSLSLSILFFYLLSYTVFENVGFCLSIDEDIVSFGGGVIRKDERRVFSSSENGEVSRVNVRGEKNESYLVEFITMEPNTLFLPVLLHADMIFYVQSGSGRLSYIGGEEGDADKKTGLDLKRGDVYRLEFGSVYFIESNLDNERIKLRICSIFAPSNNQIQLPSTGPYSSIRDMLLGFDDKILQAAFRVPEEIIEELKSGSAQPLIIHREAEHEKMFWENKAEMISNLLHRKYVNIFDVSNKKKKKSEKTKLFNFLNEEHDFENCNGWSTSVTSKQLKTLKHSDMGVFMVNLTKGSMMGPHWNPRAIEIAIVVQGEGMVRVVCPNKKECENRRFKVEEGDVFVVPRFHPMAQMSFNNNTFVFVGFSTSSKKNHPQYLAGKSSVLQTLDRDILAISFNVANTTIDRLLAMEDDSIILECTSCAEDEEMKLIEEEEKKREEERKREEEEKRKKEEEEEAAREKEAEEERKREEEAEAEARREREEEEARRREKEEREREEEEEAQKAREKEEAKRREEEEAKRREEEKRQKEQQEEEEAQRAREEEEAKRREEEKREREQQEEEAQRAREEEEAKRREEEKREREQQEEEEAQRAREEEKREREKQEEKEAKRAREEEEAKRREEDKREREQQEEARKAHEEEARRQEEEQEERKPPSGEEEIDWRRRREEEAREEEEAARRQEEGQGRGDGRRVFIETH